MWIPIIAAAGGGLALVTLLGRDRPARPDYEPDVPTSTLGPSGVPTSTGFKLVDKILGALKRASASANLPLGLLVGWVAKESNGFLATKPQPGPGDTKLDERGYFQLTPEETRTIAKTDSRFGDHQRLGADSDYSINAGLALIGHYAGIVSRFGVAQPGSSYFYRLVKLAHSMGSGQTKKVVEAAKKAGRAGSWDALQAFALGMRLMGPQPKKWFPFVDKIYAVGRPFGFGTEPMVVAGDGSILVGADAPFKDIPDPLDVIAPK